MNTAFQRYLNREKHFGRIRHLRDDWVTPIEYIPYIDALLGDIDLDPCSTHRANSEFIRAKRIYTMEEDGLNIEEPWKGVTYLFPPTYGRCSFSKERGTWRWSLKAGTGAKAPSVIWFRRLYREWKLRNIPEALFFTVYPEMMRICPEIWDLPMCIPKDRARLMHGNRFFRLNEPLHWGYFIYLPPLTFDFDPVKKFRAIFSEIGKVIA